MKRNGIGWAAHALLAGPLLLPGAALAAQERFASLAGGVTVVGQATDVASVRSEVVASLDLFLELPLGFALLHVYLEGNSTPRSGGVSALVPAANTDAGSALNGSGGGRVQLSEVRLVTPVVGELRAHAGVLDATGFLDVSRIANDENLFFLALPFVNNPTIAFPDYGLGVAIEGAVDPDGELEVGAVLSSTSGLADEEGASYRRMLDPTERGEGLFAGAALKWERGHGRASLGAWLRTDPSAGAAPSPAESRNKGVFGVAGHRWGAHEISGRAGLADRSASPVRGFLGMTHLWSAGSQALGTAVGRSFRAPGVPGRDVVHVESFLRRRFVQGSFATLSLQRVIGVPVDQPGGVSGPLNPWVASVRLSAAF